MKIIIDGENFRHQLAFVLLKNGKINDKIEYFKFDVRGFFEEVLEENALDIFYFTTRIKQPSFKIPLKLQKTINYIRESNRRWSADLTNNSISVIKAGHMRVRESSACIHCGKKTLVLQEKGVDVRVATELVMSEKLKSKDPVILVSSDSDLTPALDIVKNQNNKKVIYLCYSGSLNRSISAQTYKTITFDDKTILKYYRGIK